MAREIKFRLRLRNKESNEVITVCAPLFSENNGLMQYPVELEKWEVLSTEEYTGLLYRDGKEVYEGDVVQFPNGERYEVTYDDMSASFALTQRTAGATHSTGFEMLDVHEAEVIGSIHTHPHLLQEQGEKE